MGLHQKEFGKTAFEKRSRQTSKIRQEVLDIYAPADTSFLLLPQLFDIDSIANVIVIATYASRLSKCIRNAIGPILSINEKIDIPFFTSPIGRYYRIPSNKGSPIHSSF